MAKPRAASPPAGGLDYRHDGVVAGGAAVVADFGDGPGGRSAEDLATIAQAYPGGAQIHEDNISAAGNVTKAKLPFSQALQNPALATTLLNAALQAAAHPTTPASTTTPPTAQEISAAPALGK